MCERCRKRAEKALQLGVGFKVTPGEAAKITEILDQILELEERKDLWWERQMTLAGLPEGVYQFLPSEGVIVPTGLEVDETPSIEDLENMLEELKELANAYPGHRKNPNLKLM